MHMQKDGQDMGGGIDRVIALARRTGAGVVITDSAGVDPMVVMPLAEYERLLDGGVSAPPARGEGSRVKDMRMEDDGSLDAYKNIVPEVSDASAPVETGVSGSAEEVMRPDIPSNFARKKPVNAGAHGGGDLEEEHFYLEPIE